MLRLAFDENLDNRILTGLKRRIPAIDAVRVQDVGLIGADDPAILEWAAEEGRILVTHDVATVTRYAYDRVRAGLPMPGVIEVHSLSSIGRALEDLVLIVEASLPGELEGQVQYVPL